MTEEEKKEYHKLKTREWRIKNKNRKAQYDKQYYKQYYKNNKEKIAKYQKFYRSDENPNIEKVKNNIRENNKRYVEKKIIETVAIC